MNLCPETGQAQLVPSATGPVTVPSASDPLQAAELLVETIQKLSLASNLDQVIAIVHQAARRLTGADGATFVLPSGSDCYYVDEDAIQPLWKGRRFPASRCISGWVMENCTPASIPDIYKDERIPIDAYEPTFVRSLAMVPIRTQAPIGAIGNYWAQRHTPTRYELRLLQALADSTAVAMEKLRILSDLEARVLERTGQLEAINNELRAEALLRKQMEAKVLRLSLTDDLTGLSNRRGFLMRTEQMLKLIHRMETHAWLFYIDLDGLKQVNDSLGHETGDRLIQSAAQILRESFRDSDILGRIGGDEFLVFAVASALPAPAIELRIQENLTRHNNLHPDLPPIAMSIGVARCDASSTSLHSMIREADAAMYTDKARRRIILPAPALS
jgi:diguanylate cyclase (GGDEF)-like protein